MPPYGWHRGIRLRSQAVGVVYDSGTLKTARRSDQSESSVSTGAVADPGATTSAYACARLNRCLGTVAFAADALIAFSSVSAVSSTRASSSAIGIGPLLASPDVLLEALVCPIRSHPAPGRAPPPHPPRMRLRHLFIASSARHRALPRISLHSSDAIFCWSDTGSQSWRRLVRSQPGPQHNIAGQRAFLLTGPPHHMLLLRRRCGAVYPAKPASTVRDRGAYGAASMGQLDLQPKQFR